MGIYMLTIVGEIFEYQKVFSVYLSLAVSSIHHAHSLLSNLDLGAVYHSFGNSIFKHFEICFFSLLHL